MNRSISTLARLGARNILALSIIQLSLTCASFANLPSGTLLNYDSGTTPAEWCSITIARPSGDQQMSIFTLKNGKQGTVVAASANPENNVYVQNNDDGEVAKITLTFSDDLSVLSAKYEVAGNLELGYTCSGAKRQ